MMVIPILSLLLIVVFLVNNNKTLLCNPFVTTISSTVNGLRHDDDIDDLLLLSQRRQQQQQQQQYRWEDYLPQPINSEVCSNNLSLYSFCPNNNNRTFLWTDTNNAVQFSSTSNRRLQNPLIGNIKALILLVQFPEHSNDRNLPSRDYFHTLCNTNISDYFVKMSYGQYNVSCDVQSWITTNYSQTLYANSNSNLVGKLYAADFFKPVLNVLDREQGLDFSMYDSNDDGIIDIVIVLHSGYAAEYRRGQECNAPKWQDRIHSQGHVGDSTTIVWTNYDGTISMSGYAIASAYDWVCDDEPSRMGVIIHEWIHILGARDLYDAKVGTVGGIASFDIMANAYGPLRNGQPSSLSSYNKEKLNWIEYVEIKFSGNYTIPATNRNPIAFIIRDNGFGPDEYLLIENRPAIDYDIDLFGGGLLINHIDDSLHLQGRGGYPGMDGWPENGIHYKVALLQADGDYDLEIGNNNGDSGDFWKINMTLGPSYGGTVFPNTDRYQNGIIEETGISITITGKDENNFIYTFEVTGLPQVAAMSSSPTTAPPSPIITISPTQSSSSPILSSSNNISPTHSPTISPLTQQPTIIFSPSGYPTFQPSMQKPNSSPQTNEPTLYPISSPTADPTLVAPFLLYPSVIPTQYSTVGPTTLDPKRQDTVPPTLFQSMRQQANGIPTILPSSSPSTQGTIFIPTQSPLFPSLTGKPSTSPSLAASPVDPSEQTTSLPSSPITKTLLPSHSFPSSQVASSTPTSSLYRSDTPTSIILPVSNRPTTVPTLFSSDVPSRFGTTKPTNWVSLSSDLPSSVPSTAITSSSVVPTNINIPSWTPSNSAFPSSSNVKSSSSQAPTSALPNDGSTIQPKTSTVSPTTLITNSSSSMQKSTLLSWSSLVYVSMFILA